MTHICELLGVKMVHTSEDKPHVYPEFGEYHPNPTGFFEITQNLFKNYMNMINTPYSGCKMIVPVTGMRWEVVNAAPSRIIFMVRDPEEIKQSQEAFYAKQSDTAYIRSALAHQKAWLDKSGISYIMVNYRTLVQDTTATIKAIADFIESDADIEPAVRYVNPELYRFNKDLLIAGA